MFIKSIPIKIVIPVLAACAVVVALQFLAPDSESIPLEFPDAAVTKEPLNVPSASYSLSLNLFGQVKPELETLIKSEVTGRVTNVASGLESGAWFSKGDVLLQIDDIQYREMLATAEQVLADALFQYERENALASQAREDLSELPEASQSPLALRGPQLQAASKKVDAAKAKVKTAYQRLSMTVVKAPYDAYVSERSVGFGDLAEYGQALVEIFSGDSMLITAQLSRKDLEVLRMAQQRGKAVKPSISVSIDGGDFVEIQAQVLSWGEVRDPKTQSQSALVRVSNNRNDENLMLKPGSLLSMKVDLGVVETVFHVGNDYIDGQTVAVRSQSGETEPMLVEVLSRTHSHSVVTIETSADYLALMPINQLPLINSNSDFTAEPGSEGGENQLSASEPEPANTGSL